jgi:hypothetical protein
MHELDISALMPEPQGSGEASEESGPLRENYLGMLLVLRMKRHSSSGPNG